MLISLRASNGQYLTAEGNGGGAVNANRNEPRTWEQFHVVPARDRFGLTTSDGWFLRADHAANRLVADAHCVTGDALFRWDVAGTAVLTEQQTYLAADQGGGSHVEVDRSGIGEWERWRAYDWANGTPPTNVTEPTPGPGLAIPEHQLHGAFLYSKPFFTPSNILSASEDELDNQIIPSLQGLGNVAVVSINWHRADEWSDRFMGVENPEHTIAVLQKLDNAGLAPLAVGYPNHYITEVLDMNFNQFYADMQATARLVAPYVRWFIAMWEGAETLGGRFNAERRLMMEAIRRGTVEAGVPKLRIGRHERAMEGVFIEDIQFIGPVVCCLQTGFGASESAIRTFIEEDTARVRGFAAGGENGLYHGGRFGGDDCAVVAFEHSIPDIDPRWRPVQTWAEAQSRGQVALNANAFLDISGGQVR